MQREELTEPPPAPAALALPHPWPPITSRPREPAVPVHCPPYAWAPAVPAASPGLSLPSSACANLLHLKTLSASKAPAPSLTTPPQHPKEVDRQPGTSERE